MSALELVLLPSSSPQACGTAAKLSATPPSHQRHVRTNAVPAASAQAADDRKKTSAGALKSGSRAATIPASATMGFTSASSLVRSRHFDLEVNKECGDAQGMEAQINSPGAVDSITEVANKPRKRTTKNVAAEDAVGTQLKKPRARKSRPDKADAASDAVSRTTTPAGDYIETKPKKSRVRKSKKETCRAAGNAGTRAEATVGDAVEAKPKKPRARKPKKGNSETIDNAENHIAPPTAPAHFTNGAQELEPARDPDDRLDLDDAVARKTNWTPAKDTISAENENNISFTNMVTSFAMKETGTTRKRRAESANAPAKASKKARTITGLVTGQSESNNIGSRKVATAKKGAKSAKAVDKLLSPASAMLKLDQQDLLFGTSSQLASAESPSTLRRIQQAIQESEHTQELWSTTNRPTHIWKILEKKEGGKSHWSVSNRGENGELLRMQSNVYLPKPDRTQEYALLMDGTGDESRNEHDDAVSSIKSFEGYIDKHFSSPPRPNEQAKHLDFLDIDDLPPSAQAAQPESPPNESLHVAEPSSLTALSLGSPVKGHRKNPSKARAIFTAVKQTFSKMPIQKDIPKEAPKNDSQSTPLKTKNGGRFAGVEEISDTEDDESLSPTPPRGHHRTNPPSLSFVPTQASLSSGIGSKGKGKLKPAQTASENTPDEVYLIHEKLLEWSAVKAGIFTRINCHIKTMRPSSDPLNPNWADRMHMHESIVLEDFTDYLTTPGTPLVGGVMTVHKRATKEQVKAWNNTRLAQGKLELVEKEHCVFAVAKLLEVYMVKEWCQEASVTCIHRKEAKGRGGGPRRGLF